MSNQVSSATADTVNIQVTLGELDFMLGQGDYSLYVTDKVAHQGEYPPEYVIYWYWSQTPNQPETRKLFDLAVFAEHTCLPHLSNFSAFMPDVPVTLHVPRWLCDAETLAFIEGQAQANAE